MCFLNETYGASRGFSERKASEYLVKWRLPKAHNLNCVDVTWVGLDPEGKDWGPFDIMSEEDYKVLENLPPLAKVTTITAVVTVVFDEDATRALLTAAAMKDPNAYDAATQGTSRATTHARRIAKVVAMKALLDIAEERVQEGAGGDKAGGDGDRAGGDGDSAAGDVDNAGDGEGQYEATLAWRGTPQGEENTLVIRVESDLMVKCPAGCLEINMPPSLAKAACCRAVMRHILKCPTGMRMLPPSLVPAWTQKLLAGESKASAKPANKEPMEAKRKVMAHPVNAFFARYKQNKTTQNPC